MQYGAFKTIHVYCYNLETNGSDTPFSLHVIQVKDHFVSSLVLLFSFINFTFATLNLKTLSGNLFYSAYQIKASNNTI